MDTKITISTLALIDLLANAYFYDLYARGKTLADAYDIPWREEYPNDICEQAWDLAKTLYDENQ